ncbi:unnamed protein product [Dibothriocephalus latus]|uniref:FAR1 domain-containing protein n=1 Tax=Dibothriocephalus latus TaxID=60516 RepID=A0A3P7LMM2_DIBLA|nr:unnamed protein product [Dibothriocephalus latus]
MADKANNVVLDCGNEFLAHFGGKAFSSFDVFNKVLQAFEQVSLVGPCYLTKCKILGYGVGGTKCPTYFSVGTKRHKLIVRHYNMQHNHGACMDLPLEDTPSLEPPMVDENLKNVLDLNAMNQMTVRDCTEEFLKIFQTTSFDTFNELQAKMDEFQMVTGNRYVKTNTRRLPPDSPNAETLVYSHLVYICYRYGTNVTLYKSRKPQRTAKIGCRSKIYFYVHDNRLHEEDVEDQGEEDMEEVDEEEEEEEDEEEVEESSLPLLSMMFQQPGCASHIQLESTSII